MKRLLPVLAAALLAPLVAVALLRATRDRDPLRPAPDAVPPAWLAADAAGAAPRAYADRIGRTWWRYDFDPGAGAVRLAPPADAFPDGCEAAWFVRRGTPLLLRPSADEAPLAPPGRGRVRSGRIFFGRLPPGASLELAEPPRPESLFVSFAPARVRAGEAGCASGLAWGGDSGRGRFRLLSLGLLLLLAALAARHRARGCAAAGLAAVAAAFALAALWFDSPVWSREGRIDKGDDSFYLAYAQNLANHGTFFRSPTSIGFGARELDHCHGLPGTALMLSPPLLARALPAGAERRGGPVTTEELRAMRATSMLYALLACLLLFGAMRARRGGAAPPSAWDALVPALLLWGSSLPRWAFVRSVFSHPAELFLLCLAVFLAARPAPRRERLRDLALAATVGLLALVRGEYLPVAPLFLLLPRRAPAAPADAPRRARALALLRRYGPPLLVLAAFAAVYAAWVSRIGTGYGRPADAGLPFADGAAAVLGRILRNAGILLRSFAANGGLLLLAAVLAIAAPLVPSLRARAADLPLRPRATAALAALLFLLNACFTPPLGDEFGHRYALKLYPFALLWLGTLLAGPRPATRAGRAALAALATLPAFALLENLHLLLRTGGTDLGQNFSMLSNLQLRVLPPCGAGAVNLRLAVWLLLLACSFWLLSEILPLLLRPRPPRH